MRKFLTLLFYLSFSVQLSAGYVGGQSAVALGAHFPSFGIAPESVGGNAMYEYKSYCERNTNDYFGHFCYQTKPVAIQFIESISR